MCSLGSAFQELKSIVFQYKKIAQVNEDALKQMEFAHETFKIEVLLSSYNFCLSCATITSFSVAIYIYFNM